MFPNAAFAPAYFAPTYWPPIVVVSVGGGGGKGRYRARVTTQDKLPDLLEQIRQEDEEIIAVLVAAVEAGVI